MTSLNSLPGSPAVSIVPTENRHSIPAAQVKITIKFITKIPTGTSIILAFEPTNSAAASNTAIDICNVWQRHNIAIRYKKAKPQAAKAMIFKLI